MKEEIVLHAKDNVCVRLTPSKAIPAGHKVALRDIGAGEYVIKYGAIIGRATQDIRKGEWVHTHNVKSHLDESVEYSYTPTIEKYVVSKKTFMGYKRPHRRAGIRNDIYIIPTVGCVNNVCRQLEQTAQAYVQGSIDGIFALTHQFGCSQLGEDNQNIKKLLCAMAKNPNASFVLFVGLGCENNGLDGIKNELRGYEHIAYYNCQEVEDDIAYGLAILKAFAEKARKYKREEVDFSELCIGLKCGGSDGFSGITANPLVGKVTDKAVQSGGSAVLTEVPEMFGAEQRLMNKCVSREVFNKYVNLITEFKKRYTDLGFPVYENPSPGNKAGGITTLEEKSLGCIEKAGRTAVVDVLAYGEQVKEQGVSVLDGPGNDLIAATALGASGCQLVLFTTGRGTPFSTFVPTVKIATNHGLAEHKNKWIDFDASTMDEDGLWRYVCAVASGEQKCKSESMREIAFFKTGATL